MTAQTATKIVTAVRCDTPGCGTTSNAFGMDKDAREALRSQGWKSDDKARTDTCPNCALRETLTAAFKPE